MYISLWVEGHIYLLSATCFHLTFSLSFLSCKFTAIYCRFVPANLENIFSKYGRTVPGKLTIKEIWQMTEANRNAFDFFGWSISFLFFSLCLISIVAFHSINLNVIDSSSFVDKLFAQQDREQARVGCSVRASQGWWRPIVQRISKALLWWELIWVSCQNAKGCH